MGLPYYILKAGLYDQHFYWSNWAIQEDYILQSWSTLKLLSNDGSLIDKKLIVKTGRDYFFDQSGGYSKQPNGWLTMNLIISLNYRTLIKVSK